MRSRRRRDRCGAPDRRGRHDGRASASSPATATSSAPPWSSPPAGRRSPRWAPPASPTIWRKRFGLKLVEPRPALVPLTLGGDEALFRALSGVATAGRRARRRRGVSRSRALHPSRPVRARRSCRCRATGATARRVAIDFLPEARSGWLREASAPRPRPRLAGVLAEALPDRLAEALAERLALPAELGNMPTRRSTIAERRLAGWTLRPTGTEGYRQGRSHRRRDQHRRPVLADHGGAQVPGLYVIGEAVDVTGWLGGYNFQWAWASGGPPAKRCERCGEPCDHPHCHAFDLN